MEKIAVMVAGLPGKMATLVAEAILSERGEDMFLYHHALAEESGQIILSNSKVVHLVPTSDHTAYLKQCESEIDLIVDFTLPKSVNPNAELYCKAGIPFVMGTTGGDRQKLIETVAKSDISAVIAANMAIPVVVFQAMIKFAAENFSNSFEGFNLLIRESHQAQKQDPSGTAVSLLEFFAMLGMPLKKEQIIMVRDPKVQEMVLGIPREYLGGHGYHTYTMLSPDGTVMMRFKHNVLGRSVYVDGALKAIRFLAQHMQEKSKVFSMMDVLRG